LNKKNIEFKSDVGSQGETIGKSLEVCLKEWGIKKVCCVNVDKSSANNIALTYLIRGMSVIEK
jgi:orotate phosphoribosyltransferase-like protein